ncbi:acyl-CoA thioesterase II [uncultured Abyssibacter sp.]|uniref:acyl-CoA thioesterase II n=1 Tax=uncultured Abyssibacter sp. TaxID=2320202 RepID=UPI0032B24386
MATVLQDFLNLLDLEYLEDNLFRGESRDLGGRSVFGGQVLGQALVAATRTVNADRPPNSLHAYFLRPGDMEAPIVYDVERSRDGGSFSWRRVKAIQHGQQIFSMMASFHIDEPGFEHQATMPDVPPPEELVDQQTLAKEWVKSATSRHQTFLTRASAFEFRPVNPTNPLQPEPRPPSGSVWFKASGVLPDDPMLHRCVLAYASDYNLLGTSTRPHGRNFLQPDMIVASLDHALWFHRPLRADDWLLYHLDSPSAQGARGIARGLIFNRAGTLVASVAQEGLIRDTRLSTSSTA